MHTRSIGRLTATLLTATFATLSACQPQEPLPPAKAPPAPTATSAASAPEPELPAEGVRNRYEGEKLLRKWKTMSNWVSPPG